MKLAAIALAGAVLALPPASFRAPGYPLDLAAAGPRVAVGTSQCVIRVTALAARARPVTVAPPAICRGGEAGVDGVWLGRSAIAAQTIEAPSPHGESYGLWTGALPRGPLRQQGDDWGWTDSDSPPGYGCAWSAAAGGGVIAIAQIPNRLAVDQGLAGKPACPAGPTTTIRLIGAAQTRLALQGSWSILATDGKRLALARLNESALQTGELAVVDLHGSRLATRPIPPVVVRAALDGWLTPEGLVLETAKSYVGPSWTVPRNRIGNRRLRTAPLRQGQDASRAPNPRRRRPGAAQAPVERDAPRGRLVRGRDRGRPGVDERLPPPVAHDRSSAAALIDVQSGDCGRARPCHSRLLSVLVPARGRSRQDTRAASRAEDGP